MDSLVVALPSQRATLRKLIISLALTFQYMNDPHVYNVFSTVNERLRTVLLVTPKRHDHFSPAEG